MVVVERLRWLRDQILAGRAYKVSIGVISKGFIVNAFLEEVSDPANLGAAVAAALLENLLRIESQFITVDHGHRTSAGMSRVRISFCQPAAAQQVQ